MFSIDSFIDYIMNSYSWNIILKFQRFIMFWTSIIMLSILGAVVFARYILHADIFGYDELVLVDSFWMYFIGASYAMYEENHIKADILSRLFNHSTQALMKVVAGILQTLINIVFNVFALQMIIRSIKTWPVTSSWNIPFIVPQFSILIGFTLMSFYLAIYTLRDLSDYISIKRGDK